MREVRLAATRSQLSWLTRMEVLGWAITRMVAIALADTRTEGWVQHFSRRNLPAA